MSLNIKEIIDSEKFVGISDFKFSEFCSSENFQKEIKRSDVTILEEKNEKNINYVWYISNNFKIKSNSIIAAGSVVIQKTITEENSIYAGIPAKKIKDISQELITNEIERIAKNYIKYSGWYK